MFGFTVIVPPVVLTLIPPSVVSPWFGVGFVPQDAESNRGMHWRADLPWKPTHHWSTGLGQVPFAVESATYSLIEVVD